MVFALIASLKFHNPHFLYSQSYLTYGRIHVAHKTALLYGFAVPGTSLGVGLWLLCRLGRSPLPGPGLFSSASFFWNIAVVIGLAAILCGGSTGFESFAMPGYVTGLLLVYLLIALCGLLAFHRRAEAPSIPRNGLCSGVSSGSPGIFSTASMLLLCLPVRGVSKRP